jgi:lipopolysaccharide export system permease protein
MPIPRILSVYLLREASLYGALGFLAFASVLVTQNLLRRLDQILAAGFHIGDLWSMVGTLAGWLLLLFAPSALSFAFLFGVLVSMARLSSDSEIVAMRACGLGLRHLVAPFLAVGLAIAVTTAVLFGSIEPAARLALRSVVKDIASRSALLEPGKFSGLGRRVVYVGERDRDGRVERVVISDQSEDARPFLVFAEGGQFAYDAERGEVRFRLENGDIHIESTDGSQRYRRITFSSFDYAFDVSRLLAQELSRIKPAEMTLDELHDVGARARAGEALEEYAERRASAYDAQLQRRLALPVAPVLFALVGVPLGLRRARGARSWGAMACVVLVFGYYALLSLGQYLAEDALVPAVLGLWLPNAVFAALAAWLLWRARVGES